LASIEQLSFMQAADRILVTRFKSMGDILFTLPALHALRDNFPRHKITFLTSREFMPLLAGFRDVDEVVSLDRSVLRSGNLLHRVQEMCSLMVLLHRKKFFLVVDFQGYGETALITWLTQAPQRWGTVYKSLRRYAYTRGVRRNPVHPAESNLLLLKQCGLTVESARNEFVVPESALAEARQLFSGFGLNAYRPSLFIQPFTSSAQKDWPLENFVTLANHWRNADVQVLFGGGPSDLPRLEPALRAGFPVSAGAPLLVSVGLAKLCTVFVGGDTGLLHIAMAMNKRVVMIQGPHRHRERFYPFRRPDWKLMPAMGAPISTVSIRDVINASQMAFADCASHFAAAVGE
jgi:ADP-heptose:LPS heptosyltransferase